MYSCIANCLSSNYIYVYGYKATYIYMYGYTATYLYMYGYTAIWRCVYIDNDAGATR